MPNKEEQLRWIPFEEAKLRDRLVIKQLREFAQKQVDDGNMALVDAIKPAQIAHNIMMNQMNEALEKEANVKPKIKRGAGIWEQLQKGRENRAEFKNKDIAEQIGNLFHGEKKAAKPELKEVLIDDIENARQLAIDNVWKHIKMPHQILPLEGDRVFMPDNKTYIWHKNKWEEVFGFGEEDNKKAEDWADQRIAMDQWKDENNIGDFLPKLPILGERIKVGMENEKRWNGFKWIRVNDPKQEKLRIQNDWLAEEWENVKAHALKQPIFQGGHGVVFNGGNGGIGMGHEYTYKQQYKSIVKEPVNEDEAKISIDKTCNYMAFKEINKKYGKEVVKYKGGEVVMADELQEEFLEIYDNYYDSLTEATVKA